MEIAMKSVSYEVPRCMPQVKVEDGNSSIDEIIGLSLGTLRNDIKVPM